MGVGLPICRSIVEARRGRIGAEGNCGNCGTRFWFTLPLAVPVDSLRCDVHADT